MSQRAMRVKDFAGHIGIPHGTAKRWVYEGMPVERIGREVRVLVADAGVWVKEHHADSISFGRKSVVYFVRDVKGDRIKIGFTSDVERRVRELRKAVRGDVELLASIAGVKATELALHDLFAANALGAEWFAPSPALVALVEAVRLLPGRDDAAGASGADRASAA